MVQMVTPGVREESETLVNFGWVDVNTGGLLASPLHEAKTNRDLRPGILWTADGITGAPMVSITSPSTMLTWQTERNRRFKVDCCCSNF